MAKCDLSIELDHPEHVYGGGDKITGTVNVLADEDVKCKGLGVSSGWRTHGRGNVAQGTTERVTLFAGQWTAGQRESYRFSLEVSDWPPSYHGTYINIDHYVDVRAKIPWSFDPKASKEFLMRPLTVKNLDQLSQADAVGGCVGGILAVVVLSLIMMGFGIMFFAFAANRIAGLIATIIILPIVSVVVAKKLLPKWLLGNVETELITPRVTPGEQVQARLAFQPRRRVTLNGITAQLTGSEICVSGSGSNRTTHRKKFFNEQHTLEGATTLQAGDRRELSLDFTIPDDVPYSFDLNDNKLTWTIDLRVDIPRWPDWTNSLKLQVHPGDCLPELDDSETHPRALLPVDSGDPAKSAGSAPQDASDDSTFVETATHLWDLRDHPDQIELLVDAVTGMTFDIDTFVERRLLYSGEEDPHLYKDGYAVWARHHDPPLPLVLYVPHDLGDEFEQAGRDLCRCRGTIVGWDHQHRRLQIKVLVR